MGKFYLIYLLEMCPLPPPLALEFASRQRGMNVLSRLEVSKEQSVRGKREKKRMERRGQRESIGEREKERIEREQR